jgi:nitrite reductase/ring-hydroxylating ferredoxin subunit
MARILSGLSSRLRSVVMPPEAEADRDRRLILKGMVGLGLSAGLLGAGLASSLTRFFVGPRLSETERKRELESRLERLHATVDQRTLELDRLKKSEIAIIALADLDPDAGVYFVDYQMRPALAFRGADGLPRLMSARCTHLGCTVDNHRAADGHIVCPCHMSFFDVATGSPTPGSPAKSPLPTLGWILKDASGRELLKRGPDGETTGNPSADELSVATVFIARQFVAEET